MTTKSISVLVVDDQRLNLLLLEQVLLLQGFEVRTAVDAETALRAIGERLPDVVMMDLQLPGTDGLALTRKLKADPATTAVRIIAVTSFALPADEERARSAGCDGYIAKPLDVNAVKPVVEACLEGRHEWGRSPWRGGGRA